MEKIPLKSELRKQIYKEVEDYIGYVEADDFNLNDKLVVKEFDYNTSYGRFNQKNYQAGYNYYSMSSLIKQKESFVFEVNPLDIEVILQKYFPDKRVDVIKNDIVDVINKYIKSGKDCLNAKIVFKFESMEALVVVYDKPTANGCIAVMEDEYGWGAYDEWNLRFYLRGNVIKGFAVDEEKVLRLAVEIAMRGEVGIIRTK